jgi:transcriptional regulator with XRE-family HTH domain
MSASHFGGRLKELRQRRGWTQQQLAERAGIAKPTVGDLEQGRYAPMWPTAVALAEALGVDLGAFLEKPTAVQEPKRGRPPKAPAEVPAEPEPKRPRGRPRKEK